MNMQVFIEHDLPCHELRPLRGTDKHLQHRWFLLGNLHYTLSNVEFTEFEIYFELRDKQGLIGSYVCFLDNWERLVKVIKTTKKRKKDLAVSE